MSQKAKTVRTLIADLPGVTELSAEELSRIDGGSVVGMLQSLQDAGLGTLSTTTSMNGDGSPGNTQYNFIWR